MNENHLFFIDLPQGLMVCGRSNPRSVPWVFRVSFDTTGINNAHTLFVAIHAVTPGRA
jgi:hypothetical protein